MFFIRRNIIKFSLGPKLLPKPVSPHKTETVPTGNYCFRAQCFLDSGDATSRGVITGYDRSITIAQEVEDACSLHAAAVPGSRCGRPELTFFLPAPGQPCRGQVYFVFE